jgi:FixJ family two-component response regulator
MDGLEVMETLQGRKIDLPTILVTDINNPRMARRAKRAGVRHILEKPWDCSHLLKLIDQMEQARSH